MMRHLISFLLVVGILFAAPAHADDAVAWALYERAIKNGSTSPDYVLITVVNAGSGSRRTICVEASFLLGAIQREKLASNDKVEAYALAQKDRMFRFAQAAALQNVEPRYSEKILTEMRESLKGYSNDELRDGFTSRQSAMSKLYSEQPKQLYGGYRDAAAHVLLE